MKVSAGPFKAFLIDWDGTLIDSLPLKIANAAVLFAAEFGAREEDVRASYQRHSGVPRRILFDRIAVDCLGRPLTDDEFALTSARFTARNHDRVAREGQLRSGTLATLTILHEKDVLTFISTSAAQEEIDALSAHFGLTPFLAGVFGSRPSFSKGPGHARHVLSAHGLDAGEVAGVGDDVADMELFREAGIFRIGITGTRRREELLRAGAAAVIDDIQEIGAYVH